MLENPGLCPFGDLIFFQDAQNIPAVKAAGFTRERVYAVTCGTTAVRGCAKTAIADLDLTAGFAGLPTKHIRSDDHHFVVQIIVRGDGCTVLSSQHRVLFALQIQLRECAADFFCAFCHSPAKDTNNLGIVIAGQNLFIPGEEVVLFAKGAHILLPRSGCGIFTDDNLLITDLHSVDNLVISSHAFFFIHRNLQKKSRHDDSYRCIWLL